MNLANEIQPSTESINCPLCNHSNFKISYNYYDLDHDIGDQWNIVECTNCEHHYLNPRPRLSHLDEAYPSNYVPFQMEFNKGFRWLTKFAIKKAYEDEKLKHLKTLNLSVGDKVLDVGCGAGYFLNLLKQRGFNVQGVEPYAPSADKARKLFGLEIKAEAYQKSSYAEGSFDLITLWHVLEHHPCPKELLSNAAHHLKPGGQVLLQIPIIDCMEFRRFKNYYWNLDLPRHLQFFKSTQISQLLDQVNLQAVHIERTKNPTSWLWACLNRLGINWYKDMNKNIVKISIAYMLIAPLYYLTSKGDWITVRGVKK